MGDKYYEMKGKWMPYVYAICSATLAISICNCIYAYRLMKTPFRGNPHLYRIMFAANIFWLFGNAMNLPYSYYLDSSNPGWNCCDHLGVQITGIPSQFGVVTGSFLYILMLILRQVAFKSA